MERYYRMVIDLYQEAINGQGNIQDRISEAKKAIANAVSTAHVLNTPDRELLALSADLDSLEGSL